MPPELSRPTALAEIKLPALFSDHMVLQRDQQVKVWGWDKPDQQVTVGFAGQSVTATADKDGRWSVQLEPLKATAEGKVMTITGSNTATVNDVLVGEVWLCSGQSNMQWPVRAANDPDLEAMMANLSEHPAHFHAPGRHPGTAERLQG